AEADRLLPGAVEEQEAPPAEDRQSRPEPPLPPSADEGAQGRDQQDQPGRGGERHRPGGGGRSQGGEGDGGDGHEREQAGDRGLAWVHGRARRGSPGSRDVAGSMSGPAAGRVAHYIAAREHPPSAFPETRRGMPKARREPPRDEGTPIGPIA